MVIPFSAAAPNRKGKSMIRFGKKKTFREEAEWWKQNKLALFKPATRETMNYHLNKHILPRLGDLPVNTIGEKEVQEFIATLARTSYVSPNGTRKTLSPRSVGDIVGVLKMAVGTD
jgi:hypothetical protein